MADQRQQVIDSLTDLNDRSEARVLGLEHYLELQQDTLYEERAAKIKWWNEYVRSQNTHIDRATPNSDLDSTITRFLTEH